jgi:aspartyl-tRNA(Asn)/glutamyl-tRNA(Gln) amidotransferase subunit C
MLRARGQALYLSGTFRAPMGKTKISIEAVRHVAKLAALALSPDEEVRMQAELDAILEYMAELDALDVSAVSPAFHHFCGQALLRRDQLVPSLPRDELLLAAPEHESGGFAVPKVLDGES